MSIAAITAFTLCAGALAQSLEPAEGDRPPADAGPLPKSGRKAGSSSGRAAWAGSRDAERAAALERGRKRFFGQVDQFGTDLGVPKPGTTDVFPLGPNGLPIVTEPFRVRKH